MKQKQQNNYNKKCLVTGANGFIGSALVRRLKSLGNEVRTIPHGYLLDQSRLTGSIPNDIDWIFHLASYGNMPDQSDEYEIFNANVIALWNLLHATLKIPYKAFINTSTSSVTLRHQTLYASTKAAGEHLCRSFVDCHNKPIVSVRPYSVYGVNEAYFRFIPTVFRSCIKGDRMKLVAAPVHDWIYIDDVVDRMIQSAETIDSLSGQSIGLGTGYATSNGDIVKMIEKLTGRDANYYSVKSMRPYDNCKWASPIKTTNHTKLEVGLEKYYESIK